MTSPTRGHAHARRSTRGFGRTTAVSEEAADAAQAVNKGDFTPITSQDELNKALAARLERERAKYADYQDLKTKASKFDELTEAQKSETQKALERAEAAERALQETQSEKVRLSVLARHQIPEDYHEFVVGSSEEELEARAQKVLSLIPKNDPPAGFVVRGEGQTPDAHALNGDPLLSALKEKLGIA